MLRKEIQEKTGLTRKSILYYEEKNLINPAIQENGYREYSENDLEILKKVSILRKVGLSIEEIKEVLESEKNALSSILRKKEYELSIKKRKKEILELFIEGEDAKIIDEKISAILNEETIYEKLE